MPLDDSDPSPVWEASETGIVICPGLSWDEWLERWGPLQQIHRSINFLIGDALQFAEDNFPDQWTQALDPQYADQHRNALWVARRIPPAERVEGLSWSTHREAASLDPGPRNELLALAKQNGWGAREVVAEKKRRASAPIGGFPSTAAPPAPTVVQHETEGAQDDSEYPDVRDDCAREEDHGLALSNRQPDLAEIVACRDDLRNLAARLTPLLGSLRVEREVLINATAALRALGSALDAAISGAEPQRLLTHADPLS